MKQVLIATQNENKLNEFNTALNPLGIKCISLNDIGYTQDILEDGLTFFDNAYKKAKVIAEKFNCLTIADDSGLIVSALPNQLGVYSKRFSPEATDSKNNELLLKKLKSEENRKAYFQTVLVVYYPNGKYYQYSGIVNGNIAYDYLGSNGFGYDPLFIVDKLGKRMAELTREEKNAISHRGNAIKKLVEDILNEVIDI